MNAIAILLLALVASEPVAAFPAMQDSEVEEVKVLFVGNSYSYYNSLSQLVEGMAQEKFPDKRVTTGMVSNGGMTLKQHWQQGRALKEIQSGGWDFVVLQEQSSLGSGITIDSTSYLSNTDNFFEYARKFDAEIKKCGAQTVFYLTWSNRSRPDQQDFLTYAYMTIAKELGGRVAPVGLAWQELRDKEGFDLYAEDGGHPSAFGSYLAAATLFSTIFEVSPLGIPGKIEGYRLENSGRKTTSFQTLVDLSEEHAAIIQKAATEATDSLAASDGYLDIDKPEVAYTIPELPSGEEFTAEQIQGKWHGAARFVGSNHESAEIEITQQNGDWAIVLHLKDAQQTRQVRAEDVKVGKDRISFTYRGFGNSEASLVLVNGRLIGLSRFEIDDYVFYNNWQFSNDPPE